MSSIPKKISTTSQIQKPTQHVSAQASAHASATPAAPQPPQGPSEIEIKLRKELEELKETAEMITLDKEIAEEKLDSCEKELQEVKDNLIEATLQIDMLRNEAANKSAVGIGGTVTVLQLQKLEEQNGKLTQGILKLRDLSAQDKKNIQELTEECELLHEKVTSLEEKEVKYLEQIKIFEEQIDVSQNAQEMVETLTQQKTDLEDKIKELRDDLDCMEKLRDLNEQLLESARENELELMQEIDRLKVQFNDVNNKRKDMEDDMVNQERTISMFKESIKQLQEQNEQLKSQCQESRSIEQQKHQIENVAYKLNFSESKMAEKEADLVRHKRNLVSMEEQMNSLSHLTKAQSTQLDELKIQLDSKKSEVAELKRLLKKKLEESSEMEIRKDIAEKKLQAYQTETESKLSSLTRQIEKMRGKEVEYEAAFRRQEEDLEDLANEKKILRDRLNKSSRTMESSMQSSTSSLLTSPGHDGRTGGISVTQQISAADESIFVHKIRDLKRAFDHVNRKNYDLELRLAEIDLKRKLSIDVGEEYAKFKMRNSSDAKFDKIRNEIDKLKSEVRQAIIKEPVYKVGKSISSQVKSEKFSNARLEMKYRMLENDAHTLLSNSPLVCNSVRCK